MDTHTALLILNSLPGIGPSRKRLLVNAFDSAEAALQASPEALSRIDGIGWKLARIIHEWRQYCDPDKELRCAAQAGVSLVFEDDDVYPPLLKNIHDPPICLYVRGSQPALKETRNALAVVGSRRTTLYGLRMTEKLAGGAAVAGWPVISGLARGIDTQAHETTLQCGGCTIAVIGSGLAQLYPQENIGLALRIVEGGGAVISEFPMHYKPDRRSFPMRNRIIAGMATGTLVVEAGLQSGSLITAAQALEQGRLVFAVPGPADTPYSKGCHALIKDGAKLVESFDDIADDFSLLPGLPPPEKNAEKRPEIPKNPVVELKLQGLELKLWSLLQDGEQSIDDLIDQSGEETSSVLAALLTLELKHAVRQLPGRRVTRR